MAFNHLVDVDGSDMSMWANSKATYNFKLELESMRDHAMRMLIDSPTEARAEKVRMLNGVLSLIEEASQM